MKCFLRPGLVISGVLSLSTFALQAGDWPQWLGPQRNGISTEKGWRTSWPAGGPKQLWKADVGVGYGTVSVSQKRVYALGNRSDKDEVMALDAASGKKLWGHSYDCASKDPNGYGGARCTPTVDGDRVYSISRQGHLLCLDAASGKPLWTKHFKNDYNATPPQWGFSESPLVEGNLLIIETGGKGMSVVALDKTTGKQVWQAGDDKVGYSSPVAFDFKGQRAVAVFTGEALVGRSLKDGAELWRYEWKTSYDVNAATPIIVNNQLAFISSGYGTGCALVDFTASPVKQVWKNKNMRNHVGTCVLWQGHLYGFDEKQLACLALDTGEVKWTEAKYGKGSVLVADGKLILYGDRGQLGLAEASPAGYKELAFAPKVTEFKTSVPGAKGDTWAMPVLAHGRLYCRSLNDLVCLDLAEGGR